MDQLWDYQPTDSGEQILTRDINPRTTFGIPPFPREVPPYLSQDKEHLKAFDEAWGIYSKGPIVYARANKLEASTQGLVKEYLTSPLNSVEPPYRLMEKFTREIIDRVDNRNRGISARDFEATMMGVQLPSSPLVQYPAIDTEVLDALLGPPETRKWTLPQAEKLAGIMNATMDKQEIKDVVGKKREAWDVVSDNKLDLAYGPSEEVNVCPIYSPLSNGLHYFYAQYTDQTAHTLLGTASTGPPKPVNHYPRFPEDTRSRIIHPLRRLPCLKGPSRPRSLFESFFRSLVSE